MTPRIDLTGRTFGRLLVLRYAGIQNGKGVWYCRCDCGTYCHAVTYTLTHGRRRSCGCLRLMPKRGLSARERQQLQRLYESGVSLTECCRQLHYSPHSSKYLRKVLVRMGVPIAPRRYADYRHIPTETIRAVYQDAQSYRVTGLRLGMSAEAVRGRLRIRKQEAQP